MRALHLRARAFLGTIKRAARKRLGPAALGIDESAIVFDLFAGRNERQGVMIDVGAHVGSALAPFAYRGWKVFAFEPDDQNRKKLEQSYGELANVHIDARAVSDQARARVPFYRSRVSTGISGLSAFHPSHEASGTVDITTLDAFCAEHGIGRVDFLKIDTEGFDLHVLRGFPWQRMKPRAIVCEFEDAKTTALGYSFHDLARLLQGLGYRIVVSEWFPIEAYGARHRWRRFTPYPCELQDPADWGNLIAIESVELYDALLKLCGRYKPAAGDEAGTARSE